MTTTAPRIFAFRYGVFRPLLTVLGMGPGLSRVELSGDTLHVRMGWAFQAKVPARPHHRAPRRSPASWAASACTAGAVAGS